MSGKPIEKKPAIVLPFGWHAQRNYGIPYRPRDKPKQEDWETVALKFGVEVNELIQFNCMTVVPDEVNWVLSHQVGCEKVSPSGNNYMFSNDASPGIIYIPPAEDQTITLEAEHSCLWTSSSVQRFLRNLTIIANGMPGYKGARIKKLVQVIIRVGYPACLDLWYFNDMNIAAFTDIKTTPAKLREMTKASLGANPFTGQSGLYGQMGPEERHRGWWQIHPIKELFADFCDSISDAKALESRLEEIDNYMYKGWYALSAVADRTAGGGGGSAYSPLVYDFIKYVGFLAKDKTHLYHAFY